MTIKKNIFQVLLIGALTLIFNFTIKSQEIPDEDKSNSLVIDSIDYGEDLLDSNEAYKQQFDSLSKDGEWLKANKSDLVRDLNNNTGEDLELPFETSEVIYVWRPYGINSYWNPYSNGSWVFSNCGWIWSSNYSWGWGPYNYGRWYYSNFYSGWIWFPGRVWASNWVTWRNNGQYVGWYPLCPRVHWRGHGGRLYTNHHFVYKPHNWVFVNRKNFTKRIDNSTIISESNNVNLLQNSKKLKPAIYTDPSMAKFLYKGPDANIVSAESGEKISPKKVIDNNSGGKVIVDDVNNSAPFDKSENTKIKNNNSKPDTEDRTYKQQPEENKTTKSYNPPNDAGTKNGSDKAGKDVEKKDDTSKQIKTTNENIRENNSERNHKNDGTRKNRK